MWDGFDRPWGVSDEICQRCQHNYVRESTISLLKPQALLPRAHAYVAIKFFTISECQYCQFILAVPFKIKKTNNSLQPWKVLPFTAWYLKLQILENAKLALIPLLPTLCVCENVNQNYFSAINIFMSVCRHFSSHSRLNFIKYFGWFFYRIL